MVKKYDLGNIYLDHLIMAPSMGKGKTNLDHFSES